MDELIRMEKMVKVFPPAVRALDRVTVSFETGEIHAVIGENGAGKSTLMKALYGLTPADSGNIFFKGKPVLYRRPGEAIAAGIGMVHQEILLIPEYSVWENIILGVEPVDRLGRIDRTRARRQVLDKINEFQFNLDPDAQVENISVAARQKVEILKLLYRNVSVLILDEPTAVLTPQEIPQLFDELRRLRDNGHTIIFISHHLDEVLQLSDRITVMRKGRVVDTIHTINASRESLARMMVGRDVIFASRRTPQDPGNPVVDLDSITVKDARGRENLSNVSLTIREGEIVGIAGVEGNGQLELVNAIIGLQPATTGQITVQGKDITRASILERRKLISFVPQDRGKMGASLTAPVIDNAMMTHHLLDARFSRWKGLLLNMGFARTFTDRLAVTFSVSMPSKWSAFRTLSGGNQQKAILGRELLLDTPFVLLDQPTRGLDVGSIEYIHDQILKIRSEGRAVLMVSADLEELFLLADRIAVLWRGQLVADMPVESTTVEDVGMFMLEGSLYPL